MCKLKGPFLDFHFCASTLKNSGGRLEVFFVKFLVSEFFEVGIYLIFFLIAPFACDFCLKNNFSNSIKGYQKNSIYFNNPLEEVIIFK